MRANLENNIARKLRMIGTQHDIVRLTLTGTFVIPDGYTEFLFLDGGLSDRTVRLPVLDVAGGQFIMINNVGATNDLNVTDSLGAAVTTIQETQSTIFVSSRTAWSFVSALSANQAAILATIAAFSTRTVTSGAAVLAATDIRVWVNFAGAVALTLPDAAAWLAAHPFGDLVIKDISGAASTNNVTINRAGGDTIDGAVSLSIASDFGGWRLQVPAAGKWGIV